jgi:diguanylate cyclase (GGDEF)-like protein
MKRTALLQFCFALSLILLNYLNINIKLFFVFTLCLCCISIVLIEYFVLRQIQYEAEEDNLTTLKNKKAYYKQKKMFNSCHSIGVLFLDINNLKITNDSYGHKAGDELIMSVANVIKKCTGADAFSYRFGGDEFVMIFTNISKEKFLSIKNTLLNDFSKIHLELSPLKVSVAIGQSYENNTIDIEKSLQIADGDMYENKRIIKIKTKC